MNRRHFLRHAGAALALPFLPSLGFRAFGQTPGNVARPLRYGFIYTPNGYNQATFLPRGTGAAWELTPALAPLAGVQRDVTLLTGLDRTFAPGTGAHEQSGSCWLTSSSPAQTLDGSFPTNLTLDQVIARQIGGDTALPSLELSCNDFTDNKETKYYESISWYGPGYAASTEKNPRQVFQRLFGQARGGSERSVLDAYLEDARALGRRLGSDDQRKLGEYLESVRATERRIQLAEEAARRIGRPPLPEPEGIPARRSEYLRLMADLMVAAMQLDLTRVVTFVVDPERWDNPRIFDGVFDKPQNHHVLTHTKGADAAEKITAIDRFHVAFFRHVVDRLKTTPDGDGTLFDHSVVVMGSGMSDGDQHVYHDLQVLLAGRAGGAIRPGQHLHFDGKVPLANLWLSLARTAGVPRDTFADSTGLLTDVVAV